MHRPTQPGMQSVIPNNLPRPTNTRMDDFRKHVSQNNPSGAKTTTLPSTNLSKKNSQTHFPKSTAAGGKASNSDLSMVTDPHVQQSQYPQHQRQSKNEIPKQLKFQAPMSESQKAMEQIQENLDIL